MQTKILLVFCFLYQLPLVAGDFFAIIEPITKATARKITGKSWLLDCPIELADLRLLTIRHWDFKNKVCTGELIVHQSVAEEVAYIFKELFESHFQIEKMYLIEDYFQPDVRREVVDEYAAEDNNTSAFFYRMINGEDMISEHSLGTAIDINPRVNPFVFGNHVRPANAKEFVNRDRVDVPGMINKDSICHLAFMKCGWKWGGDWKYVKDYRHFCKKEIIPASFDG